MTTSGYVVHKSHLSGQKNNFKGFYESARQKGCGGPGRWGPWAAPGSTPIIGEGCGVQGGNPFGSGPNGCKTASEHVVGRCCGGGEKGKLKLIRPYEWNIDCLNYQLSSTHVVNITDTKQYGLHDHTFPRSCFQCLKYLC